jgi:hypothetical protein
MIRNCSSSNSDIDDIQLITDSEPDCNGKRKSTCVTPMRSNNFPWCSNTFTPTDDATYNSKHLDPTIPLLVHFISARDTWKKKWLPNVDEFHYGSISMLKEVPTSLCFVPHETHPALTWKFEMMSRWLADDTLVQDVINRGKPQVAMIKEMVTTACENANIDLYKVEEDGVERYLLAAVVNVPGTLTSDVGDGLLANFSRIDFAVMYRHYPSSAYTSFSFRSREGETDVSRIARQYHNGNGHRCASGGRLPGLHCAPGMQKVCLENPMQVLSRTVVRQTRDGKAWVTLNSSTCQRQLAIYNLDKHKAGVSVVYHFEKEHIVAWLAIRKQSESHNVDINTCYQTLAQYHACKWVIEWKLIPFAANTTVLVKARFELHREELHKLVFV